MKKINFCEYRNLIVNLSDYYGNNFQLYNKQESQQKEGGGGGDLQTKDENIRTKIILCTINSNQHALHQSKTN